MGSWRDEVSCWCWRDGDMVGFSRREGEEFESEGRRKVVVER